MASRNNALPKLALEMFGLLWLAILVGIIATGVMLACRIFLWAWGL